MSQDTPEAEAQVEQVAQEVKKNFSLRERLENRGLRRVTTTVFLDENLGARHKAAAERVSTIEAAIEAAEEERKMAESVWNETVAAEASQKIAALHSDLSPALKEVDDILKSLKRESLTIALRAVPAKIAKDCRRRAKVSCDISGKDIPEDRMEDYVQSYNAHLLNLTVVSVTDNATEAVNDGLSYQDAVDLIEMLPPGQYQRLAGIVNEIQFRDAFSEALEVQEDFS